MVLGVGNSRLAVGIFRSGELEYVNRLSLDRREDWAAQLGRAWSQIAGLPHASVAGASVNPSLDELLGKLIQEACGLQIQWVGKELEVPVEVRTQSPGETGIDRILNTAAAFEQIGKACVVVDAGTAITVDLCDDNGDFLGGAIAPGVSMMLDALHEKAAQLPRVDFDVPTPGEAVADSTRSAIRHGIFYGIRGMVRELVENYATELGAWPDVIATGGDAEKLFSGWEVVHAISPDLTLYGIALAYSNHHLKNEL